MAKETSTETNFWDASAGFRGFRDKWRFGVWGFMWCWVQWPPNTLFLGVGVPDGFGGGLQYVDASRTSKANPDLNITTKGQNPSC